MRKIRVRHIFKVVILVFAIGGYWWFDVSGKVTPLALGSFLSYAIIVFGVLVWIPTNWDKKIHKLFKKK